MARMRRSEWGKDKPMGWSWWTTKTSRKGFLLGVFGGRLSIPNQSEETSGFRYDFDEWFIRLPFVGSVLVLTRIRPTAEAWR